MWRVSSNNTAAIFKYDACPSIRFNVKYYYYFAFKVECKIIVSL